MAATSLLNTPLKFENGQTFKNRIVKGAMTEALADDYGSPTPELVNLYREFAKGGCGMLITGNIQVDRRYLERPGNVTIDGEQTPEAIEKLSAFAHAGDEFDCPIWAQIGHPGRQGDRRICKDLVGPSNVPLDMPPIFYYRGNSLTPLTVEQIKEIQQRFANAAAVCKQAGFAGIELHAAHGYLLSSFLNPKANIRTDEYGGSIENRARMLLETFKACRAAVGNDYPIGVKLNSSDFQKGGLTVEDSLVVAKWLHEAGCDLLEISGGNYEASAMFGNGKKGNDETVNPKYRNAAREAYFVQFADDLKAAFPNKPLMITGGFRSFDAMEETLQAGSCDLIGVGRPITLMPDCPAKLLRGEIDAFPRYEETLGAGTWPTHLPNSKSIRSLLFLSKQYYMYLSQYDIGKGQGPRDPAKFYWKCGSENSKHEEEKAMNMKGATWLGGVTNNAAYVKWGALSRFMKGSRINTAPKV